MRIPSTLFLCALALGVPEAGAAVPVADSAALVDTLNATNSLSPDEAKAAESGAVRPRKTRAQARAALRNKREAERQRIREKRFERRLRANAVRDSARRADNLYVGAALSIHAMAFGFGDDTDGYDDTETAPSVGMLLGFRSHALPKLGFKTGAHYHTGFTAVEREYAEDNWIYSTRSRGSGGTTSSIDAVAQAILGPFGRFAIEPGILYGLGWHSAGSISLEGYMDDTYGPKPRFTTLAGVMGISLFLGRHDQINPTGWIAVGKVLGEADALVFQMNVGLAMAFREGE